MSLSNNKRCRLYPLSRHPWFDDRRAANLTRLNDTRRIKQLEYKFGVTNWWEFMQDFVNEMGINHYRGFIEAKVTYWDGRCFSLFYRIFDLYLVAIHDGHQLYELGISGDNQWLFRAILTGYKELYSTLLNQGRIVGTMLSFKIFEAAAREVIDNVGQPDKWKHSFGIFALMVSEPGRFHWIAKAVYETVSTTSVGICIVYNGYRLIPLDTFDYLYKPCPDKPADTATEAEKAAFKAEYKKHSDVAYIILGKMSPALQRQFENYPPQNMLAELQKMFEKPPAVEIYDLVDALHSCRQAPVTELHALLIDFEKGLKDKAPTPQVFTI
nr:hypothetical protein [Tanacetum cinerariifolium]